MPPSTSMRTVEGRSPRSRCTRPGVERMNACPEKPGFDGEHVDVVQLGGQLG